MPAAAQLVTRMLKSEQSSSSSPPLGHVAVSRHGSGFYALHVLPLNERFDAALHHADVRLEALGELRDHFREEHLVR